MSRWAEVQAILTFGHPWHAPLFIVLAATGASLAIRWHYPRTAIAAWAMAWVLIFTSNVVAGGSLPYSLSRIVEASAVATTVSVLTAALMIPWKEQLTGGLGWGAKAWWLGRAALGLGVAWILLIALEFYTYLKG